MSLIRKIYSRVKNGEVSFIEGDYAFAVLPALIVDGVKALYVSHVCPIVGDGVDDAQVFDETKYELIHYVVPKSDGTIVLVEPLNAHYMDVISRSSPSFDIKDLELVKSVRELSCICTSRVSYEIDGIMRGLPGEPPPLTRLCRVEVGASCFIASP